MNPLAAVKNHPVLAGSVVIGGLALILLMKSSGSSTVSTTSGTGSDTASANALAAAQLGANAQIQGLTIQAGVANHATDAALSAAEIDANSKNAANVITGQIAALQITTTGQSTDLANTLQAGVINKQTDAAVQSKQIDSNTSIQTTKFFTDALVKQGQQTVDMANTNAYVQVNQQMYTHDTQSQQIAAWANVNNNQITASKDVQTQSWWNSIFG